MRIVHETDHSDPKPLATDVEVADSIVARGKGLMFRRSIPEDYGLVFEFETAARRSVHMLFVPFPIDVLWLEDERVRAVKRLSPWRGFAANQADTLIELPAGTTHSVEPGDRVRIES